MLLAGGVNQFLTPTQLMAAHTQTVLINCLLDIWHPITGLLAPLQRSLNQKLSDNNPRSQRESIK